MDDPPVKIWHCNWNWCPETFRRGGDLRTHLYDTHFNAILKVKKRDWDVYLRSTEGRSGATDSFTGEETPSYPTTHSTLSQNSSSMENETSQRPPRQISLSRDSPKPSTPSPPLPRTVHPSSPTSTKPPSSSSSTSSSSRPPHISTPLSSNPSAKRRWASVQSSPMSTPSVPSIPQSPTLSNMITDAINMSARINANSPTGAHRRDQGNARTVIQTRTSLPRRLTLGAASQSVSLSPTKFNKSPASKQELASPASSQVVEEALTQDIRASSSQPSLSRIGSWVTESAPAHASVENASQPTSESSPSSLPQPPAQSLDTSLPLPPSYYGSHAVDSVLSDPSRSQEDDGEGLQNQSQNAAHYESSLILPLPHVKVQVDPDPEPVLTRQPELAPALESSPIPRRLRTRSKTPAVALTADAIPAQPTRVLRSRSKTPAPVAAQIQQSKSLPLHRRTGRSRTPSVTVPSANAESKQPPMRRASSRGTSVGPIEGGRKAGRANPGGLAVVDEQPDSPAIGAGHGASTMTTTTQVRAPPSRSKFRSGTLQLPRRTRTAPNSRTEAQALAQPLPILSVTVKRELLDDMMEVDASYDPGVDPSDLPDAGQIQGQAESQSESQETGGYREGYGFDLGPMQLMTQQPYPSQSQGEGWSNA